MSQIKRDIYKERDYAKEVLDTRRIKKNNMMYELGLVYVSLRDTLPTPEIKDIMKDLLLENFKDTKNTAKEISDKLDKIIEKNKDRNLIQIDSIGITQNDMDYIVESPLSEESKKGLFSIMVMHRLISSRFYQKNEKQFTSRSIILDNASSKDLKRRMNLKAGTRIFEDVFHELYTNRMVDTRKKGYSFYLDFINDIESMGRSEVIYKVEDFTNLGHNWDAIVGNGKIIKCIECETLVKARGNKTKYCNDCKVEKEKERHVKYNQKR